MKKKFGYIVYHNNRGNVAPFKVTIPVTIEYDWAPSAAKAMRALLAQMKDIEIVEPQVTIKSRMKSSDIPALEALSDAIVS